MSIDGDMRAGVIDVHEARHRRSLIEKESQMYGSMDGAMKFVTLLLGQADTEALLADDATTDTDSSTTEQDAA